MAENRMTKDTVPEGLTVPMALMDMLPVVFFGGTGVLLGILLSSPPVEAAAVLVFLSGLVKAIWKMIAAVSRKNIWPMFVQMRILMPVGMLVMIAGVVIALCRMPAGTVIPALTGVPQIFFFVIGILGMAAMIWCAKNLDSADPRSSWIEQGINTGAQACIFLGLLTVLLK